MHQPAQSFNDKPAGERVFRRDIGIVVACRLTVKRKLPAEDRFDVILESLSPAG